MVEAPFCVLGDFCYQNILWMRWGENCHDFSLKLAGLTVPKRFTEEHSCVSQKFWYRKMFEIRQGAAITTLRPPSMKLFVSLYEEVFLEEPSESWKKLCYWKFSTFQWKQVRSAYHHFPSNFFCLAIPKFFAEAPFCLSENFYYRSFLWIRGVNYHDFSLKMFCLTVPKHIIEEPICVQKLSGVGRSDGQKRKR